MEGSIISSADNNAVSYWKSLPLSKYAEIHKITLMRDCRGKDDVVLNNYLMLDLGIALNYIFETPIEICWDTTGDHCAPLS